MAMKTDFEDSSDVASPFVDEVANPGGTSNQRARATEQDVVDATVKRGRKFLTEEQKNTIRRTEAQAGAEINKLRKK
jgi:hypothetical protein